MTQIHCHSEGQQYALFTLICAAWSSRVCLVWWDGKSCKTSKDRIWTMSPEHVYHWGLLQNSTHSRMSHCSNFSGLPILWGISLHQQSILTCKYSIHEYSVFSFKFPSEWSLGGLFLTQISAFTKSIQFKQTVTALVSVLFSWQAVQNSSKPDYLLAAKSDSNLN